MQRTRQPFFTIGHSNRKLDEFVGLLAGVDVALLVDIRKMPASRSNPQFNMATLAEALVHLGISYQRMEALGGLRGKSHDVPSGVNGFWNNQSFHNYADYALSAQFNTCLKSLIEEGQHQRAAIMCSEAVWWRCHRRIVADYLITRGETVIHIMGGGRLEPASLTRGALIQADGTIIYPALQ